MADVQRFCILKVFAVATVLTACGGVSEVTEKSAYKSLSDVPAESLAALSERSYFFGHQSVGVNIVEGLSLVLQDRPDIKVEVVQAEDAEQVRPGVFVHSRIGKNREPKTKIQAFTTILDSGVGEKADAAFVKFCYLDAGSTSNMAVEELFAEYKHNIKLLQAKYPGTQFVHFTIPLRTVPEGIKVRIKNLLGRDIPEYEDNAQRGKFNAMLRAEYFGKEPLFDVAHLESIVPKEMTAHTFSYQGQRYETLAPDITYDGGHLNDEGRRWLAEQLLVFLAELEYKS